MILKYQDEYDAWHWIRNVDRFTDHGYVEADILDVTVFVYDELVEDYTSSLPRVFNYTQNETRVLLVTDVTQAFLVSPDTGSTIDVLVAPERS